VPADEAPHLIKGSVTVVRGRDAESIRFSDRFAEEFDQRTVDARVLDASGREKKFHDASLSHSKGFRNLAQSVENGERRDDRTSTSKRPTTDDSVALLP
jgi:hypothetical protein